MINHVVHWIPLVVYTLLILFFSSQGVPKEIQMIPDYLLHTCEFMVLGLFLYYAFETSFSIKPVKLAIMLIGIGLLIGIGDEIIQSYTPSRDGSIKDLVVDFFALLLSQIAFYHLNKSGKRIIPELH